MSLPMPAGDADCCGAFKEDTMGFGLIRGGPPISVALFRMTFGILWLDLALQKAPWVINDGHRFGWLYGFIWTEIKNPTFEFYKNFLHDIVLPNFNTFGYLTFFNEMFFGISLLLGCFTVLGGIGGALFQVNIMLGAYSVPGEWYWVWPLLIFPQLLFAHTRAGRTVGIDRLLYDRLAGEAEPAGIRKLLLWLV